VLRIDSVVRPVLSVEWNSVESLTLDPAETPISAEIAPALGGATDWNTIHVIDLEKLPEEFRLQRLTFKAARKAYDDGCLQAALDEYIHVLRDALGLGADMTAEAFEKLAEAACGAIGIRPAGLAMDDIRVDRDATAFQITTARLRSKYAMAFLDLKAEDTGTASKETMTEASRAEKVREAFNSPFWPFVLITTSVGQEGLDFHLYCHAVVHWNLPSNPVDLEQREGRIHRYKGHAVRKNVAACFASAVMDESAADPWSRLFDKARTARDPGATDLVPFWLYPVEGGARIERHIAALPLSRDLIRMQDLRRTLTVYRMVFGQPRQDDLIDYLLSHVPPAEVGSYVSQLQVDLSPPIETVAD
jgi:hypothetical protein